MYLSGKDFLIDIHNYSVFINLLTFNVICLGLGIAMEGDDYTPVDNEELIITQSVREQCVNISIVDDNILERTEMFMVILEVNSSRDANVNITTFMAAVFITDNDSKIITMPLLHKGHLLDF